MSRGDGNVMRLLLEKVTDEWQPVVRLAGPGATRSELESTRRACKRLVEQGRLQADYIQRNWEPGLWSEICAV
jgi:hypothetical protein